MTYTELLNLYVTSLVAKNSRVTYINLQIDTLKQFFQTTQVSLPTDLKPSDISHYFAALFARGLQASTVASVRGRICAFLNWASEEEYLPACQWSKRVAKIKQDEDQPNALTENQARRLVIAVQVAQHKMELVARRDLAMVYVLLDTGIRHGELLRLNISDVDLQTGEIKVSKEAKGRKSRRVWVSDITLHALKHYLRFRRKYPGDWLWTTKLKKPMGESNFLKSMKRYGRMAGIQEATVHQLRHTALTQMVRSGMKMSVVRAISGHAQMRTLEKYVHLANDDVMNEAKEHSPIKAWI